MKALTLWQPWASLVACGAKQYETRSWAPPLRAGELLAIHAAARPVDLRDLDGMTLDAMSDALFDEHGALPGLGLAELEDLPRGVVLAVARFVGVQRTERLAGDDARQQDMVSEDEFLFGDYSPGRYGWKLEVLHRLETPIGARGGQKLWNWDAPDWLMQTLGGHDHGEDHRA